ncbi:hypothetical protein [Macrococcus psychrotolerans]
MIKILKKYFRKYKENIIIPQAERKCISLFTNKEAYKRAVEDEVKKIIYYQYLIPSIILLIFSINSLVYYINLFLS